jgi:type II secretory pathway predicted ATPase ExeA
MPDTNEKRPTREEIQRRAYERYLQRGCQPSDGLADWIAAEKELSDRGNVQHEPAHAVSPGDEQRIRSTTMLLDFYGLREQPFGVTPDPAYLYASKTHSEALQSLSQGITDTRGFLALIAEPGMGKTTLLYQLLEQLQDSARAVLIFQSECTSHEFIEYILHDLGVDVTGMGLVAMHGKLNEVLFEELLKGKRFVLVVDEAQNLADSVLETVRMLSNFETHNAKLLQIILAGQPGLAAKLAQPRLSQLRQRVSVLSHLEPFSVEETRLYIEHRLKVAGHSGEPIFEPASIRLIARQSNGIPRSINNLCYNSMQLSHGRERRTVTPEIVQEAITRLDMESLAPRPSEAVPNSEAPPVLRPAVGKVVTPHSTPVSASMSKDQPMKSSLTYAADEKSGLPKWPGRTAILAFAVLSGSLLLGIFGRAELKHRLTSEMLDHSSSDLGQMLPAERSDGTLPIYDATPQDTGNGQVLTVAAGSQQTLKELSLRYIGHFDSDLVRQISSLNPDLKDPDHLDPGQLIRIPLPPGAMRKINDTAETTPTSAPGDSPGLFTRLTALLRYRR